MLCVIIYQLSIILIIIATLTVYLSMLCCSIYVGGAKVKIALRVSNGCGDDIFVDATARLLQAPDTHVSTYSKMLIPGLARTIEVTFTVPETRACCQVLGFVDVLVLSQRHTIAAATMGRTGGYFRGTSSSSAGSYL